MALLLFLVLKFGFAPLAGEGAFGMTPRQMLLYAIHPQELFAFEAFAMRAGVELPKRTSQGLVEREVSTGSFAGTSRTSLPFISVPVYVLIGSWPFAATL